MATKARNLALTHGAETGDYVGDDILDETRDRTDPAGEWPKGQFLNKRAPGAPGTAPQAPAAATGDDGPDVEGMTRKELNAEAKARGMAGYSKLSKDELVDLLKE